MQLDPAHYLHRFDQFDWPTDRKIDAINALIHMMICIYDWCRTASPEEIALWICPDSGSATAADAVESNGLTQQFNKAATGSADGRADESRS